MCHSSINNVGRRNSQNNSQLNTELFVLVNATWSALNADNVNVDPVTERIAPPKECKEAAQIQKCISVLGEEHEHVCIDIVVDTQRDAKRHNKRLIRKAASAKRAALEKRLDFLLDDLAKAVEDYNVFDAVSSEPGQYKGSGSMQT